MNTGSDGVLLPPQEFVTEILRLEETVGVARQFATLRTMTSGSGIKYLLGADDVEIFDTAEGGKKKSTKLSFNYQTLLWRKFAGILPITDELTEDSAIDLWNEATKRFARAYTVREDQLVFTEVANGGNTKAGIVNVAGTKVVTVDSISTVTYDDFVDMMYGVPSMSGKTGRWFLNRKAVKIAMKLKDENKNPMWMAAVAGGNPATILGAPYTETEVLQDPDQADPGDAIIVFGDLRYSTLAERTDLKIKIFDTGSVGDPDDSDQDDLTDINLLTDDGQAMRCVKRMNAICRFPAAFAVMKIKVGS
jgi:HK97 family phage major capsid protein